MPWLYALACMMVHWLLMGCPKTIDVQKLTLKYACAVPQYIAYSPSMLAASLTAIYAYLLIAIVRAHRKHRHVRFSAKHKKRQQHERRLVLQGAAIGLSLLLANIGYNMVPALSEHAAVMMLANWCNILNCMLSPVILLALDTTVRQHAMDLCNCGCQMTATRAVSLRIECSNVAAILELTCCRRSLISDLQ